MLAWSLPNAGRVRYFPGLLWAIVERGDAVHPGEPASSPVDFADRGLRCENDAGARLVGARAGEYVVPDYHTDAPAQDAFVGVDGVLRAVLPAGGSQRKVQSRGAARAVAMASSTIIGRQE